ncbi:MAG: hypothetical protein JRC54_04345 [Deltaproteobacteria bacterium]|jgi:hypothetical protein|nr:hypothetical protein [Deltaproteobacteria bacterium]
MEIGLLGNLFGSHRAAAILTEILMEFTVREKKKKSLPNRCCLATFGAE